jgi:hypothetical protein
MATKRGTSGTSHRSRIHALPRGAGRHESEPARPRSDTKVDRPSRPRATGALAGAALTAALLAAAVLLAHGWCLADGTVLDDHWHQKGLREHGWTLRELLRTAVIAPGDFIHTWWQTRDVRWEYARPLFILCMKVVYHVLGRDDALALHAFSLVLHFASALMVSRLCYLLTRRTFWSFVAGLLFVLYPHATVTVAWPSSQNAVLQTTFLLAALLSYCGASRLSLHAARDPQDPCGSAGAERDDGRAVPRVHAGWLAATILWWLAALFTRENAVLLPVMLAALDLAFAGRRHLARRWALYASMALIALAFVAWRMTTLPHPMPDVYVRRPDGDWIEYAAWCAAKLLHYVCTAVWLAPMMVGPTGRHNPWIEALPDSLLMLAIVAALGLAYWRAARHLHGFWVWPLWILLSVLPVVPVVATPHSGYMCGVGVALALVLGAALPNRSARLPRGEHGQRAGAGAKPLPAAGNGAQGTGGRAAAGIVALYLCGFAVFTMFNRWQWTGLIAAERYVPAWIGVAPPERSVQSVFLVNLPFANIYAKRPLVDALGPWFEDVDVHVLAYAPDPVLIEQRSIVRQLDEHSFQLRIEGQPYFSRLLGRFLMRGFRGPGRFRTGERIATAHVAVHIDEADAEGVRAMTFIFPRPLSDPAYCFYATTPECGAARLRFRGPPSEGAQPHADALAPVDAADVAAAADALERGSAAAARILFAALARGPHVRQAEQALRPAAQWLAQAIASPVQAQLDAPTLTVEQWDQVRRWWDRHVDDEALRHWVRRHEFDHFIKEREEVPHARMWAAKAIRTDLYLTGPPFPGPRP